MQTPHSTPRKTDRRTRYTIGAIKDALLELLARSSFDKLTVASLCRQAEITRATFYAHFPNLNAVLNEVLDDALTVAEKTVREMGMADRMAFLERLTQDGTADDLRRNEHMLSPCQRIATNPKYLVVFQDPTLSSYVIQRVHRMERNEFIDYATDRMGLTRNEADRLFMMIIYGLFHMNRAMNWSKDDHWYRMQFIVLRFMFGGFDALEGMK